MLFVFIKILNKYYSNKGWENNYNIFVCSFRNIKDSLLIYSSFFFFFNII